MYDYRLDKLKADDLIKKLEESGEYPSPNLIYMIELTEFNSSQIEILLPLLWRHILSFRKSDDYNELATVGAAIRKYIGIIPIDRMDELAVLLKSGDISPLSLDLEIEIAKTIFQNFEVHPPEAMNTHPELAKQLLELVEAYINPRVLVRDKYAAVASLATEALVAMRSFLAYDACKAVSQCPYSWFVELVSNNVDDLYEQWCEKSPEAASWLNNFRKRVFNR